MKIWTKENPIMKTWKRIKSLTRKNKSCSSLPRSYEASFSKSKSWHCTASTAPPSPWPEDINSSNCGAAATTTTTTSTKQRTTMVAPEGCFTLYVGPKKERFVVKTKLLNHPLFKIMLEDAETEYGYRSDGPIILPCEVDFFFKVLAEMESCEGDDDYWANPPVCGLCSPYRYGGPSTDFRVVRRYSSYKLLKSPTVFKLNKF